MNVYVRELVSALAQAGVAGRRVHPPLATTTRPRWSRSSPGSGWSTSTPGPSTWPRSSSPTSSTTSPTASRDHLRALGDVDALHANYWLSGVAGHRLKHELDLPLVSTFHTLARVKAETGDPEPERRVDAEAEVIGCSDAILASCAAEADQLERLYGADPSRIEIVPPGVDHAFFSPGDRDGARTALATSTSATARCCCSSAASSRSRASTSPSRALAALAPTRRRARGGRRRQRRRRAPPRWTASTSSSPSSASSDQVRMRRPRAAPPAVHLLPGRRRRARAEPVRVLRSRRPRGGRLRHPGGGRRGRRAAHARRARPHRLPRRGPRPGRLRRRTPSSCSTRRPSPPSSSRRRPRRARGYTWSTAAGRLRRVYADLTARALVDCR